MAGLLAVTLGVLARAVSLDVNEQAVVAARGPGPGEEEHV
jgi:hypothetical protein